MSDREVTLYPEGRIQHVGEVVVTSSSLACGLFLYAWGGGGAKMVFMYLKENAMFVCFLNMQQRLYVTPKA